MVLVLVVVGAVHEVLLGQRHQLTRLPEVLALQGTGLKRISALITHSWKAASYH